MKRFTVVGAGIGDPDLITVKGKKVLESADVVLYDALANEALLDYVPDAALKIFVGKRRGFKAYEQEEINEMIVRFANENCHVVRLKGGDPFVFGRGREEMMVAEAHGIETAYVPGISSAIAAAGVAHIPVTFRNIARSFWVITATTETGEISEDISVAAKSSATIVILMGLAKLESIVEIFKAENKAQMPIAVIHNASSPTEIVVIGNIENIVEKVKANKLKPPTVIIIGEVVKLEQNFRNLKKSTEFSVAT